MHESEKTEKRLAEATRIIGALSVMWDKAERELSEAKTAMQDGKGYSVQSHAIDRVVDANANANVYITLRTEYQYMSDDGMADIDALEKLYKQTVRRVINSTHHASTSGQSNALSLAEHFAWVGALSLITNAGYGI